MARKLIALALLALFLVAAAAPAQAKTDRPKDADDRGSAPSHAPAKGLAKRAPPDAAPPARGDEPAPEPSGRGASSARNGANGAREAAHDEHAAPPIVPTPLQRGDAAELRFGAPGGTVVSGASFAPGAPGARDAPEGAPWWVALLWALPFVGVGGAGAVLALRRREAAPERPAQRGAPPPMTPVEPSDVDGLLRNGHAAVARGALADAIAWFDAALRLVPTLAVAHFCKGVCLAASGRVAEAYGALDEAVYADADDPAYRVHFARIALALGRHDEAMEALARVARDMPELGPAMLEDPDLAKLRDHPRFLMICGEL